MKTITTLFQPLMSQKVFNRIVISIACVCCISQYTFAQKANDKLPDEAYRHLATLNTNPAYRYNITAFIGNYIPTNKVQFSDKMSIQIYKNAVSLYLTSINMEEVANNFRSQSSSESNPINFNRLIRCADSMDNIAANFQLESAEIKNDACKRQYMVNENKINALERNSNYATDELTLADLLNSEAQIYFTKAMQETDKAKATLTLYQSQNMMNDAQRDIKDALLKQQCAVNVFISIGSNSSIQVAKKIDSILTPDAPLVANESKIIFTVQIAPFNDKTASDKANNLLNLGGLGIVSHNEGNGKIVFTVGNYANYTSAELLSEELIKDGFKETTVVTYTGSSQNAKPFEVIALK